VRLLAALVAAAVADDVRNKSVDGLGCVLHVNQALPAARVGDERRPVLHGATQP
jgi:hypothetical protein